MRLPILAPADMTPEQRAVYDATAAGPRRTVPPPVQAWLHSPGLAAPAQEVGAYIRYHSSLPGKWNEMAILLAARHWTSHYEWFVHRRMAEEAGLDPAIIDAIRDRRPPALPPEAQAIYDYATTLHRERQVTQAQHDAVVAHWGTRGVVDLVGICGYYTLISMTLNAFEVPLPEGQVSELS